MSAKLSVVFCWHMHQPFYREADSGRYHLPWVYLHAIKDYTDMAAILRRVPGARSVFNFVPSLMVQIHDYAHQINAWLTGKQTHLPDRLLECLVRESGYSDDDRHYLLEAGFRLNHERNLHRYPCYSRLYAMAVHVRDQDANLYLGDQFFADLVTWYHIGWLAETVRDEHPVARRILEKGQNFDQQDRRDLLELIYELLEAIPETYRELQHSGQAELSTTPYAHPIMPLLLDFKSAWETEPHARIPDEPYPGGRDSVLTHLDLARSYHRQCFDSEPSGCWPSEGAVSLETVKLLEKNKFSWTASGESVLHHSLKENIREHHPHRLYQPWKLKGTSGEISCFFRDDLLSDRIGFEYSKWDSHDAVKNFMHELSAIMERTQGMDNPCVAIIMDGENAWEHYFENGVPFLKTLFTELVEHPDISLTTFSDYLQNKPDTETLSEMVAGSWVYGTLSTWIGDPAKTRAWQMLVEAKKVYDIRIGSLPSEQSSAAEEQLRICEGSDWFWWPGDYNPAESVRDFDRLYRQHLRKLYELLGEDSPAALNEPLSGGGGHAEGGGTMRRGAAQT